MTITDSDCRSQDVGHILIRPALRTDLPDLEWGGEYSHLRHVYVRTFELARTGRTAVWVAQNCHKEIIGQLLVQYNSTRKDLANGEDLAYIFSFRVKPSYRRSGIGSRLLASAEQEIINRGFSEISLIVARQNSDAIRFYEHRGYRIVDSEAGKWTLIDHLDQKRKMDEPGWKMVKNLIP